MIFNVVLSGDTFHFITNNIRTISNSYAPLNFTKLRYAPDLLVRNNISGIFYYLIFQMQLFLQRKYICI